MRDYSRHTDFRYVSNTIKLKLKKMVYKTIKGRTPIPKSAQKTITHDAAYSALDKYHSFDYFNFELANRFYSNSSALISEVIVALCYYNEHGKDDTYIKRVLAILGKLSIEQDCLVFRDPTGYKKFEMPDGSISGITQAKLTSLFLRAGMYEEAQSCLNGCLLSHEQNGPYREINDNMIWIEEYPSDKMTMVLNGHIFNLIAFIEYQQYTGDRSFDNVFQKCLNTTLAYLPYYWKGDDILYSMYNWDFCNIHYLGIMTYQMEHLHKLTSIPKIKETANQLRSKCDWSVFEKLIGK